MIMKIYILAQNDKGYLLADIQGTYYLIDDYSKNVAPGDTLVLDEPFRFHGKHNCYNRDQYLWVSIAGDINVPNEYFPDYVETRF